MPIPIAHYYTTQSKWKLWYHKAPVHYYMGAFFKYHYTKSVYPLAYSIPSSLYTDLPSLRLFNSSRMALLVELLCWSSCQVETRIYPEKAPSISTKMVSKPTYRIANQTQQLERRRGERGRRGEGRGERGERRGRREGRREGGGR